MRIFRTLTLALALAACWAPAGALAAHFEITADGESKIVFVSKAPLESFKGHTKLLTGWIDVDLDNLAGPVALEVEVDLASFDTGKKKRNQHMRENHLETEKFPKAWFRAGTILSSSAGSLTAGQEASLIVQGTLDLHGVQKEMDCALTVGLAADGSMTITGSFPVLLSDFAIERPKFLVMKLADEQHVEIELVARPH